MIVFRVDVRSGLGHLMRMKWLALALTELEQECHFFIDTMPPVELVDDFPAELHLVPNGLKPASDADYVCNCLHTILKTSISAVAVDWVIVDGYDFDVRWEARIKAEGYQLMAFDDIERPHLADAIVDAKWQGKQTYQRYATSDLALPHCHRLLGPDYVVLAPEYRNVKDMIRAPQLMFSLGGGGDWTYLTEVIRVLLQKPTVVQFNLLVVIGPYASNYNALLDLAAEQSQLTVVREPASLCPHYRESMLFIGALGTSLYELAATLTPALTFSIAANQQNDITDLSTLGHYLHLENIHDVSACVMANLISQLAEHPDRLMVLRQSSQYSVDGLGADRISRFMLNLPDLTTTNKSIQINDIKQIALSDTLVLRTVTDKDINNYLIARNRPDNSWRMTVSNTICRADHYFWWFSQSQSRESFALEQDGKVLLYLWQQLCDIEQQKYWIGGWFAADDKVNFVHAQLVLEWQLTATKQLSPEAAWVAVIHKDNKFVNLLNQRAGFVPLPSGTPAFKAAVQLFPKADLETFNFVVKWPTEE